MSTSVRSSPTETTATGVSAGTSEVTFSTNETSCLTSIVSETDACERKMAELEFQLEEASKKRRTLEVETAQKEDQLCHMHGMVHKVRIDAQTEVQQLERTLKYEQSRGDAQMKALKDQIIREQQLNSTLTHALEDKQSEIHELKQQLEASQATIQQQDRAIQARPADPITRETMEDRVQALQLAFQATLTEKEQELQTEKEKVEMLQQELVSLKDSILSSPQQQALVPLIPTMTTSDSCKTSNVTKDDCSHPLQEFATPTKTDTLPIVSPSKHTDLGEDDIDSDITAIQQLLDTITGGNSATTSVERRVANLPSVVQSMDSIYSKKEKLVKALDTERKNRESERRRHQEMQTLLSKLAVEVQQQNLVGVGLQSSSCRVTPSPWPHSDTHSDFGARFLPPPYGTTTPYTNTPTPDITAPEAQLGMHTSSSRATPHRPRRHQPCNGHTGPERPVIPLMESTPIPRLQSSSALSNIDSACSLYEQQAEHKSPQSQQQDCNVTGGIDNDPPYFVMSGGQPPPTASKITPPTTTVTNNNSNTLNYPAAPSVVGHSGNKQLSHMLTSTLLGTNTAIPPVSPRYLTSSPMPVPTQVPYASRSPVKDSPMSTAACHSRALSPRPTPLRLALEYRRDGAY